MATPSDITLGSLIGDSLALGPHWIYDQREISEKLGRVTKYHPPMAKYHPGKAAGDFTHYGDQELVLLRSLVANGGFGLDAFAADWRAYWEDPATISYRDGATKATLANLQGGAAPAHAASPSHDMAGAARGGPLFLLKWDDEADLIAAARALAGFTHGDPAVIEAADFFTRVALAMRAGKSTKVALQKTMELGCWSAIPEAWLDKALESADSGLTDAAALDAHGLSCSVEDAFPGICHLLLRHPQDPAVALMENATAGGDSAARGMILGMIHGAAFPVADWPAEWLDGLRARDEVMELIGKLS